MTILYTVDGFYTLQRLNTLENDNSGKKLKGGGTVSVKEGICF